MAKTPDIRPDDPRFDVRTLPHDLRRKELTHDDVDAWLAALPDDADEAVESEVLFTTPYANRLAEEAVAEGTD